MSSFSWPVGVVVCLLILFLIAWCLIATKKDLFKFEEIGKIQLDDEKKSEFIDTLSSSPYLSQIQLFIIRSVIAVFNIIVLIIRITEGDKNGVPVFAYYTVWGWTLLSLYFILSSFITLMSKYQYRYWSNDKIINSVRIINWILFQILCGMVLMIDLVVWLFNPNEMTKAFTEFTMHSINLIFIYMELWLTDIPLNNINHSIFVLIIATTYTIFTWIVYISFNIPFPYPFVDFSNIFNAISIPLIFIFVFICWIIGYGFKRIIINRCLRGKHSENQTEVNKIISQNQESKNECNYNSTHTQN